MTSPSVDLDLAGVMPYGVTVEGKGNRNAEIVTESSFKNSNVALKLPDGPCRVVASWDGPEAVRLVHTGHGYPVVIPAGGGGIVLGWPRLAPLREKQSSCRTFLPHPSQAVAAEQSRCTHSRSSNRRGGGLSGHSSKCPGNYHLLDSSQRNRRVLSWWIRLLSSAVHRCTNDFSGCAQRLWVNSPIDGSELQSAVSFGGYGGWEAGRACQRRSSRGHQPVFVVLFQRRWRRLRRNNPQVLANSTAGVVA